MITGEKAGFLHYPTVTEDISKKTSAGAATETRNDEEES